MHMEPRFGRSGWTAAIATLSLVLPLTATAQFPPELPMTYVPTTGVRASAMGGAYTAIADDISALDHNPAGLAQIRRSAFSISMDRRNKDQDATYLGRDESTSLSKTYFHNAGFAYPFPTYQGSLVLGGSYQQWTPLDSEYLRSGAGSGVLSEREEITETGNIGAWQVGLAWDLSPTLSLGGSAVYLSGDSDRFRSFEYEGRDSEDFESTITETTSDIRGYTGRLGVLYRGDRGVQAGFVVHLPQDYTIDGEILDDVIRYQENPADTLDYIDEFTFEDKLTLPARFSVGLAYENRRMTLTGDATFADWTEIDYDGPIRFTDESGRRDFAYRSTVSLRIGAEYRLPNAPLDLRAGFASNPVPYDVIGVNIFDGLANRANFDSELTSFSLGAGYDLDASLTADLAYVHSSFERSGREAGIETVESLTEDRFLFGVTFRQTR